LIFPFTWTYSKCRKTGNVYNNDPAFPRIDGDSNSPRNNASQHAIPESVEQFIFELQLRRNRNFEETAKNHGETSESISITSDIPTPSHIPPHQESEAFSLSIISEYETSLITPAISTQSRTSSESSLPNQENKNSEAGLCKITLVRH